MCRSIWCFFLVLYCNRCFCFLIFIGLLFLASYSWPFATHCMNGILQLLLWMSVCLDLFSWFSKYNIQIPPAVSLTAVLQAWVKCNISFTFFSFYSSLPPLPPSPPPPKKKQQTKKPKTTKQQNNNPNQTQNKKPTPLTSECSGLHIQVRSFRSCLACLHVYISHYWSMFNIRIYEEIDVLTTLVIDSLCVEEK